MAKKSSKKESKMDQNSNAGPTPKRAIRHSWSADRHFLSADWHKLKAWPRDSWIRIISTLFNFLEMRMHPNSYLTIQLIFRSIPTSINRGCLSKFSRLFHAFWPPTPPLSGTSLLFFSPLCSRCSGGSRLRNFFSVSEIF